MILSLLIYIVTPLITFLVMEGVAWLLHKYVMHGVGWYLHEDHHRPRQGRLEKNDAFSLFFAIISFLLIATGMFSKFYGILAVGFGIMLYGIGYFMVHDVFFHRRIRIRFHPQNSYIKRILNAHAKHHQLSTAHSGICFGFLYASKKYSVT